MQRAQNIAAVMLIHEPASRELGAKASGGALRPRHVGPASIATGLVLSVKGLEKASLVVIVTQLCVVVKPTDVDDNGERLQRLWIARADERGLPIQWKLAQ